MALTADLDDAVLRLPLTTGRRGDLGVALLIARDVDCRLAALASLNQFGYRTLPRRTAGDLTRLERIYRPSIVVTDARALSCPLPNLADLRALARRVPMIVVRPQDAGGRPLPLWAARRAVRLDDLTDRLSALGGPACLKGL